MAARLRRIAVIGLMALGLSACSSMSSRWDKFWNGEPAPKAATPEGASPAPAVDTNIAAPAPVPAPEVSIDEPTSAATVPEPEPRQRPVVAAEVETTPTVISDRLVGLDFDAVRALLGEPETIKEVAPGQEWQYAAEGCTLSIRFFPEIEKLQYRALSVFVGDETDNTEIPNYCHEYFSKRLGPK